MPSKPTTLQDHSSRLIDVHHLLHDRLEYAPKLPISQTSIKRKVERMPFALLKSFLVNMASAREEEAAVSMEADGHHPACNQRLNAKQCQAAVQSQLTTLLVGLALHAMSQLKAAQLALHHTA